MSAVDTRAAGTVYPPRDLADVLAYRVGVMRGHLEWCPGAEPPDDATPGYLYGWHHARIAEEQPDGPHPLRTLKQEALAWSAARRHRRIN